MPAQTQLCVELSAGPWPRAGGHSVSAPGASLPKAATREGSAAPRPGWIDRLAAWADREPHRHHRLGSWEAGVLLPRR